MANPLDNYFTNATPQELENISIYGVKHPIEFAPDPEDEGICMCGKLIDKCEDSYDHMTHGY